jgi:hypothetical protein
VRPRDRHLRDRDDERDREEQPAGPGEPEQLPKRYEPQTSSAVSTTSRSLAI